VNLALARDNPEVAQIQRHDTATAPFGAGDDGRVSESERKVVVASNERTNPWKVMLSAIDGVRAGLQIAKEEIEHALTEPLLDEVGDLRQNARRHYVWATVQQERGPYTFVVGIAPIEESKQRRGVQNDHRGAQCSLSQASESRAANSLSSPVPID